MVNDDVQIKVCMTRVCGSRMEVSCSGGSSLDKNSVGNPDRTKKICLVRCSGYMAGSIADTWLGRRPFLSDICGCGAVGGVGDMDPECDISPATLLANAYEMPRES